LPAGSAATDATNEVLSKTVVVLLSLAVSVSLQRVGQMKGGTFHHPLTVLPGTPYFREYRPAEFIFARNFTDAFLST